MMKYISLLSLLLFFSQIVPLAEAKAKQQISCKVVGISDGDTLTCLQYKIQHKVRLLHIDAPESAQPFGNRAKQALAQLAFKKQVTLHISGQDRYQRTLAVVIDEQGNNLNLALVKMGMAWAYQKTEPRYEQAMAEAKAKRVGLWQEANPINPANWRKNHNDKRSNFSQNLHSALKKQPLANTVDCSVKRTCNELGNYANALRHFQQCGWQALDGNNDGIPCNKLYRKANKQ